MPKGYWIGCYREIKDPAALREYAKLGDPVISAAGGRIVALGTPAKTFEAGMSLRTIVIEFDSVASAVAAYESPAYQEVRRVLGDSVVRDIRIVEGNRDS